ncbi:MAG: SUMF1/EgtB/PvdO family nonheme iron enzyme [Pseudomonadota bacterium]
MKKLRVAGLLSLILFGIVAFVICAQAAETAQKTPKEKLAILDLEAKYGIAREFAEGLSVIIRDEIHSFGNYEVMSREDLQAVASQEQLKQALGCDEGGQCLVDFGRAIGTRFMVVGSISKFGATYTISLRMLDTKGENAGVVNRASLNCKCAEDELINTAQAVAAKLMGKKTPEMLAAKQAAEKERLAAEKSEAKKVEKAEKEKQAGKAEEKRKADEAEKKTIVAEQARLAEEKTKAEEAEQKRLAALGPKSGDVFTDSTTGMEFVYVPKGCFQMGDTFGDGGVDEKPVHEVCVDGFFIGKYEVTQGEYTRIIGSNPSQFKKGDRYPVEQVSWDDAQAFIRNLNDKSGKSYRLPTEAEWEYAARSGGRKEKYAGADSPDAVAWYTSNSGGSTHSVGSKSPNGLGLYDMSGNVWEWCQDRSDSSYYNNSPRDNPQGPSSGVYRVLRGGGWYYVPGRVRAAIRGRRAPGHRDFPGFRLVLPVQ